ncbi:MAG TPA: TIR-like protein FxsC [Actinocrinis sp.]|uniref:TIR-like protein FxsC n=1 Tax=Actinocrinis sp. TaxID=1920516 RepID=UPI002DDD21A6|nr:TIR-like protein FxsC [Actinocrinis sp.]HEV2346193.1 TIR-like protein FxsC [Actinocrinis sp.]
MPSRPEAGADVPPLYFFLSYAHSSGVGTHDRFDRDALVRRFEEDLGIAVIERARHPRAIVPGHSDAHIPLGGNWPIRLASALAVCRTFVALYSAEYFDSQDCGKEWSAFAERINRDFVRYNEDREAFIPVLWLPIRPESVPQAIRNVQYTHPDLGPEYHQHGLRYLMTHRELRERYHRVVDFFASRITFVAEDNAPSTSVPAPIYQDLPNAFAKTNPADGQVPLTERPKVRIVVAAPRAGRLPRGCDPELYGDDAVHWRPYLPHYEGEVAQTAKRLAEALHFYAFIESAERCRELIPTTEATAPTILIVDPWAAQQPDLQQKLAAFDRRTVDKSWVRLVIPWNRTNRHSIAAEVDLESRLESTLSRTRARCRFETPRAVDGLETIEDLINDLPSVLWAAERHYLGLAKPFPPSSPSSTPPRKRLRLRAPGLGPGGLRANGKGYDEPHAPSEDR